jgi:hypothetical protein
MGMRRYPDIDVTTDGAGAATVFSGYIRGLIESIQYIKDGGANPLAATTDWVISDDITGEVLWTGTDVNATVTIRPRAALHDTAGAARLYAAGGTAVSGKFAVSGRIKIVIAQGGATKVGKFRIMASS